MLDTDAYNNYMFFVSIAGNFGIYLQCYQLFKDRHSITWDAPGNTSRLLSYIWSTWITVSWIIYAILVYYSLTVLISSVILLVGDIICIMIICISCKLNESNKLLINIES
jgi:hypothetical protein